MYINFLRNGKDFDNLCVKLNDIPGGSVKTPPEWQQAFWNWSCFVKRKAREIYIHQIGTGGGMPIQKILTELEEKLLQVLGKLVVIGMPTLELGTQIRLQSSRKDMQYTNPSKTTSKKIAFPVRQRQLKKLVAINETFVRNNINIQQSLHNLEYSFKVLEISVLRFLQLNF